MENFRKRIGMAAGAGLLALLYYIIMATPGLVSERDSTVSLHGLPEPHR
jgi:hypothetical protein